MDDNPDDAASAASGGDDDSSDSDMQDFDITLAATHSYMGSGLVDLHGRCVLEAGWAGRVPVMAHHSTVFPGETVPMLLAFPRDAAILQATMHNDKLFGLLCPDETGTMVSGYGVLCEMFEAGTAEGVAGGAFTFKARAIHRFRFKEKPKTSVPIVSFSGVRMMEVVVLPEVQRGARPPLPPLAPPSHPAQEPNDMSPPQLALRRAWAAQSAWPAWVLELLDYERMRRKVQDHFSTLLRASDSIPVEPVRLSFWVASNLTLSARDRLALFVLDSALLRLRLALRLLARKSVLVCGSCCAELARREHVFAMSSDGVHSNYTNPGGYMHDIVTVSRCVNTTRSGAPSAEFSWFPGYSWTVALCACCRAHVGWRFDALKRNLRPQKFYGLCRNYVQPRTEDDDAPRASPTSPTTTPPRATSPSLTPPRYAPGLRAMTPSLRASTREATPPRAMSPSYTPPRALSPSQTPPRAMSPQLAPEESPALPLAAPPDDPMAMSPEGDQGESPPRAMSPDAD